MNTQSRIENLRNLAEQVNGMNVQSLAAAEILDALDWSQFYPVADAVGGWFTGEIAGADEDGFELHDDSYMVAQ